MGKERGTKEPLCPERRKAKGRYSLGGLDEMNVQGTCPNVISGFQADVRLDAGHVQPL